MARWTRTGILTAGILFVLVGTSACQNKENFNAVQTSEVFTQDYNPHFLEVLWVIDDRSPMRNYRDELLVEAGNLFTRLDGALGEFGQYKMAITSHDAEFHKGALKPLNNPQILTRGYGTLQQRLDYFSSIFFPLLNLTTSAKNRGLEASIAALTQAPFSTDARVPLVLIYLSYSDDDSVQPSGQDPIEYYAQQLLALKNNNPDLVRVYAANYVPGGQRCALSANNEIDVSPATYEDRYFRFANRLGGQSADLCTAGFANSFDLTGLQLKVLPQRFAIQGNPRPETIQVSITRGTENFTASYPWTYEAGTREIVFAQTPPQGTTISVTYLPSGN